jgi:hypothetical protein
VDGQCDWEGMKVELFLSCHFWKGRESEAELIQKAVAVITKEVEIDGKKFTEAVDPAVPLVDHWENMLRKSGALKWIDNHCEFERVPRSYLSSSLTA